MRNAGVRIHSNYKNSKEEYLRSQGNQHQRPRNHQNRSHVTTKAFARPVEIQQLSVEDIQTRLGQTRGAQAAAFVSQRSKADSDTFNVFNQYNETVQHFFQNGHTWPKANVDFRLVRNLQQQRTFPKLVNWFLDTPTAPHTAGQSNNGVNGTNFG